jgi:hypothetical protein
MDADFSGTDGSGGGAPAEAAAGAVVGVVGEHRLCLRCGYDLIGLRVDGVCPECGTPVARSLLGDMLRFSSGEYLRTMHQGVFLILASIVLDLVMIIGGVAVGLVLTAARMGRPGTAVSGVGMVDLAGSGLSLVSAAMSLGGWWLLSAPDPRSMAMEKGQQARRLIRTMVVISAGATLVTTALTLSNKVASPAGGTPVWSAMAIVILLAGVASFVAWVVKFFAAMAYLRWLSPRIPNEGIFNRARTMMWLGPVLMTVGSLACGLGPLFALILYYNLLNWVRVELKKIRREMDLLELAGAQAWWDS